MSTKYCRLNTPGYKDDMDQGWLIQGPPEPDRWCQGEKPAPDEMGVRGGAWGGWQGCTLHPKGVAATLLFGGDRWLKFLLLFKFCICIYQYFIIFPQWTILHQKFLRRKKLGSAKREVKIKSGGTREEDVTPSCWGGGVLGGGKGPGDEGTQVWPLQRLGLTKGLGLSLALGGQSTQVHTFPEHQVLGVECWRNSVCQVLF